MARYIFILLILNSTFSFAINWNDSQNTKSIALDSLGIDMYLSKGRALFYVVPDSSNYYYKKALDLSIKKKNKKGEGYSLLGIGEYLNFKEKHKESVTYYLEAIEIFKSIRDERGIAKCYMFIADSFSYLNSLDKAIEYYGKSLKIYKKLKDKIGEADIYIGYGNLNFDYKNYKKAQNYFYKAFEIYKKTNNKTGLLSVYINLGNALADDGKLDEGLDYYNKAVSLGKELNDIESMAICYINIGDCFKVKKDYVKALEYFNLALTIVEKQQYNSLYQLIYANIAETNLIQKKYNETIYYAKRSLSYAENASWVFNDYDNHSFLSDAYAGIGDFKQAFINQKLFQQYSDSIFDTKKFEQVAKLDVLYELENQEEKINDLLKKEELNKLKIKNQRITITVSILSSIIFLLLLFMLLRQKKNKEKAYKLLAIEKEKALESDRLKSAFLANMSHEIRTPMNAIMGFSEFLIDPDLMLEKRIKFVDIIRKSGYRLMSIINDIIDISKIELNQIKIEIKEVNVIEILEELVEIQKKSNSILIDKNLKLNLNIPAEYFPKVTIKTDENRLIQIVTNLVNNAVKFTDEGFIEVGFVFKQYSNTKYVEFYVKDSGCGIPEDKTELVFDRFAQVGVSKYKEGNGLGLAICKGLLELLKGQIWVESEVGVGSTFYFTLPI